MKNVLKRTACVILTCCLLMFAASFSSAAKTRISASKKTVTVGKTFALKVLNAKKTVKWSSSNSKVAKITAKRGSRNIRAIIKAVKSGKATITAKVGGKSYKCKVTVKAKKQSPVGTTSTTVYITATGEKYHSYGCSCLKRSCYAISLSSAKAQGYGPCSLCHPPT